MSRSSVLRTFVSRSLASRASASWSAASRAGACCCTLIFALCCGAGPTPAAEPRSAAPSAANALPAQFPPAQRDYILACGGCHGLNGVSNATLVPSLKGLVGFYLYTPEGRAYLPQLPNVAFSTLDDDHLAAVLNYVVFDIGAGSVPAGTKAYRSAEVGKWRRQPLTEVSLSGYRRQIVETLISRYHAPEAMRGYSAAPP